MDKVRLVTLAFTQMIEYPLSENSMTEETRKMITDKIDLQVTRQSRFATYANITRNDETY